MDPETESIVSIKDAASSLSQTVDSRELIDAYKRTQEYTRLFTTFRQGQEVSKRTIDYARGAVFEHLAYLYLLTDPVAKQPGRKLLSPDETTQYFADVHTLLHPGEQIQPVSTDVNTAQLDNLYSPDGMIVSTDDTSSVLAVCEYTLNRSAGRVAKKYKRLQLLRDELRNNETPQGDSMLAQLEQAKVLIVTDTYNGLPLPASYKDRRDLVIQQIPVYADELNSLVRGDMLGIQ